ncbi:hypothetical protein F1559_002603 [Cyanidiococcus yangmingshanensis]|uniref:Uncharacterized protein n=1 Tax=Cyanidiococcus yangmingshanensis TaxID=2690220 RepID=A0A7J7IF05_9RHOD|nr:hypothetical protein F1559_002603 [Cyanidiococcus yangmingshanensis]
MRVPSLTSSATSSTEAEQRETHARHRMHQRSSERPNHQLLWRHCLRRRTPLDPRLTDSERALPASPVWDRQAHDVCSSGVTSPSVFRLSNVRQHGSDSVVSAAYAVGDESGDILYGETETSSEGSASDQEGSFHTDPYPQTRSLWTRAEATREAASDSVGSAHRRAATTAVADRVMTLADPAFSDFSFRNLDSLEAMNLDMARVSRARSAASGRSSSIGAVGARRATASSSDSASRTSRSERRSRAPSRVMDRASTYHHEQQTQQDEPPI